MPKILCLRNSGVSEEIEIANGCTLMEALGTAGITEIAADCGGSCSCGTCQIYVDAAWMAALGEGNEYEKSLLDLAKDVQFNSRLACQITVDDSLNGLKISFPESQY